MSELEIHLGSSLDVLALERVLKANYRNSLSADSVLFNASSLVRSDLFALGMFVLWSRRLRKNLIPVSVTFGKETRLSAKAIRFRILLHRWRAIDALEELGVTVSNIYSEAKTSLDPDVPDPEPSQRAVIGLHFFQQLSDVSIFLTTIASREPELFGDNIRLPLIGSGALRNIILQELIVNVFEHAKGVSGFTAMAENNAPSNFPEAVSGIIASAPTWEQSFLRRLRTGSYLEVVVGDHGPGIVGTLRSTWERDEGRHEHHETRELNIIEYAFGKYVSSKANPDAYLEDAILRAQNSDQRTITGLYFAKTVAAEHGALLAVRSGASWLAWDFSKGRDPKPSTHKNDRRVGSLAHFGGCQYKILFPLGEPKLGTRLVQSPATEASPGHFHSQILPVGSCIRVDADHLSYEIEGEELRALATSVRSAYRTTPTNSWFIVSLSGSLPSKRHALVLLYLLIDIQRSQKPVLLVALGETSTILKTAAPEIRLEGDEYPILCTDSDLIFFLVSSEPNDDQILGQAVRGEKSEKNKDSSRLRHILFWDDSTDTWRLRFTSLDHMIMVALRKQFESWATKPPAGIRHEGHFLLPSPSNAYCGFFWDINELVGSKEKYQIAVIGIALHVWRARPARLVALSVKTGELVRGALRWLLTRRGFRADLIVIEDPNVPELFLGLYGVASSIPTFVVTGVIGTGRALATSIGLMPKGSLKGVLAVVDARDQEGDLHGSFRTSDDEIQIAALITSPQVYYRDLPSGWTYRSIRTIDRVLHRPIAATPLDLPPLLWGTDLDKTLRDCANNGALACGHFSSGTKHFSTFILTPKLVFRYLDEIVGAIRQALSEATHALPGEEIRLSHAIYNEAARDAGQVCAMLADANRECISVAVPAKRLLTRGLSTDVLGVRAADVVIVEPAASSGATTRALLTYAAQLQPTRVWLFIIADRMSEVEAWFLTNLNSLNGVRVESYRFLSLASSSYPLADCPQCIIREEYEKIVGHIGSYLIAESAAESLAALQESPISDFKDPDIEVATERADILWAEAAMQSRFHEAVSDLSRRHYIAELITPGHEASMHCCGAILALAREMPLFREGGPLRDVLYPTLKERVIEACIGHLGDTAVESTVEHAALVVLAELLLEEGRPVPEALPSDRLTERTVVRMLTEICRWVLRGPRSADNLRVAAASVQDIAEKASRKGLLSGGLREAVLSAERFLNSSSSAIDIRSAREGLAGAWETCAGLLKKHRQISAGLDQLLGAINPSRRLEELEEFYQRSWLDRVKHPIEEKLLPGLFQLQQCGLPKIHGRRWPLAPENLLELQRRMSSVERKFRSIIDFAQARTEGDFQRLLGDLRVLKAGLFGEDSAFLALLRRLVLTDIGELSAHFDAAAEKLRASGVETLVEIGELPPQRGLFASPAELETCLEALVQNVFEHAFPISHKGVRRAVIQAKPGDEGKFVLSVEDTGIGAQLDSLLHVRRSSGLSDVEKFALAYGATVEKQELSPGFRVIILWEMVDL